MDKQPTVLFCSANPNQTAKVRVDKEFREVDRIRQLSKRRFRLIATWATTAQDLLRTVLAEEPAIVHFSGHGTSQGILLENEIGDPVVISKDALASLFELFADKVECVVLNSCYSEAQAQTINRFVPYVIGMRSAVADSVAIKFSCGFYAALGAGKNVPLAYKAGIASIKLEGLAEADNPVMLVNAELLAERKQAVIKPGRPSAGEPAAEPAGFGTGKSLIVVDIDDFTNVNRKFGKPIGEAIKECVRQLIGEYCVTMKTPASHGWVTNFSDEYYIAMNGNLQQGQAAARQMIKRVSSYAWQQISPGLFLTISCGVTEWRLGEPAENTLVRALLGVREAKMRGKNRVCAGPRFLPEKSQFFKLDEIVEYISLNKTWGPVGTTLTYAGKQVDFADDVEIDLLQSIDKLHLFIFGERPPIKARNKYTPG